MIKPEDKAQKGVNRAEIQPNNTIINEQVTLGR